MRKTTVYLKDLNEFTPGGHDDKPELRLMAYRWINRFLKGDDSPVTEPDLPKIDGKDLRAFPDELPTDELNTKIDEVFVPAGVKKLPKTAADLAFWRESKMSELQRLVFHLTNIPPFIGTPATWLAVLDRGEDAKPEWLAKVIGSDSVRWMPPIQLQDPAPFYIQRSLPLLGQTVDSFRLADVFTAAYAPKIAGHGQAGIIAAYAALLLTNVAEVVLVDPPVSHREGPIFLNILRVMDIPEALGLLAPRPLTIYTAKREAFADTANIYALAGGKLKFEPLP